MGLNLPGRAHIAPTPRSTSTNSTIVAAHSAMDEKPTVDIEDTPTLSTTISAQTGADVDPHYAAFTTLSEAEHNARRRQLLRKIDFRLLPTLAILYLINYLDKNALSQAKLSHLEKDLKLHGTQFNTATSIYFIGYIVCQPFSNVLITYIRPSRYLAIAAVVWGIVGAAQAGVQNYAGLVAVRFFLGVAESPIFPGSLFVMSSWYTRSELAHRFAWFFAGNQLASAFGGLISAGILAHLDGSMGLSAWRWLFIIYGCMTLVIAVGAWFLLPNYPSSTLWLTPAERSYASWRLLDDTGDADATGHITAWEGFKLAVRDKRVYVFLLLQHCGNLVQAFLYFFPAIVSTLGYKPVTTLLITAPVWLAAFIVSLIVTYTSGRYGNRTYHIMALMVVTCAANIMMVSTLHTAVRFVAMFLLPMGASSCFQIIVTFVASSFPRPFEKRAQVVAWGSVFGNSASAYASYFYPNSDAPRYLVGGVINASVAVFVGCLAFAIRLWLKKINRDLDQKEEIVPDAEPGKSVVRNLHAEDPDARAVGFRYVL